MATIGIWKINPFIGGTEVSFIELAKFLSRSGHGVYVYGSDKGIGPIAREFGISISPEEDIWKHSLDILLWYDDWEFKASKTMSPELVEHLKKIPHRFGVFGGFATWLVSPIFSKAIAKTDEIATWLKRHNVTTDIVTQFPINLNYWNRECSWVRQTPVIGYIGRTNRKNIGQLVSIAKSVGGNKVQLVVSDREDDEGVHEMGCEIITGEPLMKPHYQEMDIFMMTSLKEGVPRVIMEAMAMSLPVVAFGVGGIPSLNPSYHYPVKTNITEGIPGYDQKCQVNAMVMSELKGKLKLLIQDQGERERVGDLNRKRIEEYDGQVREKLTKWLSGL